LLDASDVINKKMGIKIILASVNKLGKFSFLNISSRFYWILNVR